MKHDGEYIGGPLRLRALNHVSRVCRDLPQAINFYELLGFVQIQRPSSFDFEGAWCVPGMLSKYN